MTDQRTQKFEEKKKMKELDIFKNSIKLDDGNPRLGTLMLHQDDMTVYNSWFLTEDHDVDKIIYRGDSGKIPSDLVVKYNISESLGKIGNPKNVIITYSTKDTY